MRNKNFGITITARTKSKRLPKKVLLKLSNESVIEYLIKRLLKKFNKKQICLITSKYKSDDILVKISNKLKIRYYRGYPKDVLKRIYQASKKYSWKNTISITADNPFIDLEYCLKALKFHVEQKNDLTQINHLPIGMGANIVRLNGLKKAINDKKDNDTEIWGNYFKLNKNLKTQSFKNIKKTHMIKNLRLTLDEPRDYKLLKIVVKEVNKYEINAENILKFFKKYPELKKINSRVQQKTKKKVNINYEKN